MKCHGNSLSRRNLLQVGAISGLGLTFSDFLRVEAQATSHLKANYSEQKPGQNKKASAKSVIFIFLPGGMAHQETFDPKPYAPLEYRGPFSSIPTTVPGIRFGQHLPKTAKVMKHLCVCRTMTHGEAAHERGTHNMFTGYRPSPALQFPSMGSVVAHELGSQKNLPPYVLIPNQPNVYAGTGYLSSSYAGFSLGADPARGDFKVRDLNLPSGVGSQQFTRRKSMLDAVNAHFESTQKSDAIDSVDSFYQRAYSLVNSPKAREAFDLSKENAKLRDAYGRNTAGARMLLSRRLVEAGVRFVSMTYGGWDHHDNIDAGMKRLLPPLDQGFAMLIKDLKQRGLLDSTLVCLCTEFGRTPKINATGGRDHWPKVFSSVMAGGGIKPGITYGTSSATATEPDEDPLGIEDWATTIYHCLGIDAQKELMAPGDRPIEIVNGGKVVKELLV